MRCFRSLPLIALLVTGCATARLAQDPMPSLADRGTPRTVVLEPLFELADWQTTTRTEYAQVPMGYGGLGGYSSFGSGYGSGYGNTVAISRQVQEKPLFARPQVMNEVFRKLIAEVQRRRPSWRVTSTSGAPVLTGDVTVVRTIIEGNKVEESDRTLKNLALGFGFVIWPLELVHIDPVHETERVYGLVERFQAPSDALRARLVRYPTQPDYAVNMAGMTPLRHQFGLDVAYVEGVLANETPRTGVLINGFVERLGAAVVALVEEEGGAPVPAPVPAGPPPSGPPPMPAPAPAETK
jgi:hypothetical protein